MQITREEPSQTSPWAAASRDSQHQRLQSCHAAPGTAPAIRACSQSLQPEPAPGLSSTSVQHLCSALLCSAWCCTDPLSAGRRAVKRWLNLILPALEVSMAPALHSQHPPESTCPAVPRASPGQAGRNGSSGHAPAEQSQQEQPRRGVFPPCSCRAEAPARQVLGEGFENQTPK